MPENMFEGFVRENFYRCYNNHLYIKKKKGVLLLLLLFTSFVFLNISINKTQIFYIEISLQ